MFKRAVEEFARALATGCGYLVGFCVGGAIASNIGARDNEILTAWGIVSAHAIGPAVIAWVVFAVVVLTLENKKGPDRGQG